jgi:hypothetical protein
LIAINIIFIKNKYNMLPQKLKYQSNVKPAYARSYRANIRPTSGGPFQLNDTIEFAIPTKANLVMVPTENYLRFDVAVTNASGAVSTYRLDKCGWHGVISRIRGWSGSNPLEDINNYNMLAAMLFDLQLSDDNIKFKQTILAGTRSDVTTTYTTGGAFVAAQANILNSRSVNSGALIAANLANNGVSTTQTPCLNLISMFGSLGNSTYFPLFACTSDSLRLEIQLVDSISKFCSCTSANGTISITNVEFVVNMIELSDEAMGVVVKSLDGKPLQFVSTSIKNHSSSIPMTNGSDYTNNFIINAKQASLKSLLIARRDKGFGAATFFPFSSVKAGISQYQFSLGSVVVPPKPPTKISECYSELIKAAGSISDVLYTPSIGVEDYDTNAASSTACVIASDVGYASVRSSSFYLGLDLENYTNGSKDSVFAGYNSNSDIITLQEQGTSNFTGTLRYDAFAFFDQVFVFENDVCSVKN